MRKRVVGHENRVISKEFHLKHGQGIYIYKPSRQGLTAGIKIQGHQGQGFGFRLLRAMVGQRHSPQEGTWRRWEEISTVR